MRALPRLPDRCVKCDSQRIKKETRICGVYQSEMFRKFSSKLTMD